MKTSLAITAIALAITSCTSMTAIEGSGTILTEARSVPEFHAISVHGSGQMLLSQGDAVAIEIECDDNLLEYIRSDVNGSELSLGPDGANLRPTSPIIYRVIVKDLKSIALSGSLSLQCPELQTADLSIRTSGSGRIQIGKLNGKAVAYKVSGSGKLQLGSMMADSVTLKVSGSGNVHVGQGTASKLEVDISGSGNMDLQNLQTREATVQISGSGKALLWAEDTLKGRVSGSGRVEYRGSPAIDWNSSGSGKISSLQEELGQ
jgi:hypothetical protein